MLAAPAFWGREPGLAADLLLPLGAVWDAVGRLRRALARPVRVAAPVLCVGNLVAGGAGKTPVALSLADWFRAHSVAVHVVTRGYGGRLAGPTRVEPAIHSAVEVGDEALLLAQRAPCWVSRDRAAGAAAAIAGGAELVLLDDGFQNPSIAKTVSLVVVDAGYGLGNGRVIPGGPLRENSRRALARADAAVLLAGDGEIVSPCAVGCDWALPIVPAVLAPVMGDKFAARRVVAFAGIARPAKFFATLREVGAELVGERRFPDHHRFGRRDIALLHRLATRERAQLVTTAKDYVRLSAALRAGIEVLEVEIRWRDTAALTALLAPIVASASTHGGDPSRSAG